MLVTTPGQGTLHIRCAADTAELRHVRSAIRSWLKSQGLPVGEWALVATELMCNAIAATTGGQIEIEMRVSPDNRRIDCSVTNQGTWDLQTTEQAAAIESLVDRSGRSADILPSGRGLRMIRALTSGGEVFVRDGRTTVAVWLDLTDCDRSPATACNSSAGACG
ncbi:MAG: ATP-binding protein [Acidimicrobiales bacterium]|nr:ATP-binding protein [Acidimicrobiales bacterium]